MNKCLRILLPAFVLMMVGVVVALPQEDAEVKREIDAQYAKLVDAHNKQDLKAIVGLKTADFHAIFPDGKVGDSKVMEEYSRQFLANNLPPYDMKFTIQKLTVSENKFVAVVEVLQEVNRYRDLIGKRRKIETSVVQRETWLKTPEGWKLKCVDNVRDQKTFVDGKRIEPGKPYDPDAPEYNPTAAAPSAAGQASIPKTPETSSAAGDVQKLERAWLEAYEQNDEKAMNTIVADDFVITFPDGSMQTKPQILSAIKMTRPSGSPTPKFHTEDVRARVYGDTVILTGRVITEWRRGSETVSQNQQSYTDTYLKRNGRWQVVASHLSNDRAIQK